VRDLVRKFSANKEPEKMGRGTDWYSLGGEDVPGGRASEENEKEAGKKGEDHGRHTSSKNGGGIKRGRKEGMEKLGGS